MARPRIHPAGATATDRKAAQRAALIAAGGAVRQFELSARGVAALRLLRERRGASSDTALIELLLDEAETAVRQA